MSLQGSKVTTTREAPSSPRGLAWLVGGGVLLGILMVPLCSAPRGAARPAPSTVEERHCTGCVQCTLDCPYDAITMVPRSDGRQGLMARVAPEYRVSCGICAGSCAPMSIGPPGRTGRDQLAKVRRFLEERAPGPRDVVLLACTRGAGEIGEMERFQGAIVHPVDCIGSVHSSVAEFLLRGGAGGVLFAACPERDCWNREGTKWARARLFEGREAELKERVDRGRIRFFEAGAAERGALAAAVDDFREVVHRLAPEVGEPDEPPEPECERPFPEAVDAKVEAYFIWTGVSGERKLAPAFRWREIPRTSRFTCGIRMPARALLPEYHLRLWIDGELRVDELVRGGAGGIGP